MRIIAATTITLLLLAGCGQTGPLYAPGKEREARATTETETPSDDTESVGSLATEN